MMCTNPGMALLNMGSPASAGETRAFLYRLFSDPDIFKFPGGSLFRPLFAGLVAGLRAPRVRNRYRVLGGTSPLLEITRQQAWALEKYLSDRGLGVPVEVCMRYSHPFAEEAVRRLVARGADGIVAVPLYPQFSQTTTGSSLRALREAVEEICPQLSYHEIPHWHEESEYQAAMARRILSCRNRVRGREDVGLLFLAHSIPERFVREGDPYIRQVRATVDGVMYELGKLTEEPLPRFLGYQGQVGPVSWVGPAVAEVLKTMMVEGISKAVVVPISFVSDHMETLFEIDLQYRRLAFEVGMECFERVESLNQGEDFIAGLGDLIVRKCLRAGFLAPGPWSQ